MRRLAFALPLAVAACTTAPQAPQRIAAPAPVPVIAPPPPQAPADWRDRPYTPGAWHYADRTASYRTEGAQPLLVMRCDVATRTIILSIAGNVPSITLRTSYAERTLPAVPGPDGNSRISFAASDPALDQIAFSRGRFSLSGPGLAEIDIPAWAEPSRVIEDCRG